jgi:hypothetical protein
MTQPVSHSHVPTGRVLEGLSVFFVWFSCAAAVETIVRVLSARSISGEPFVVAGCALGGLGLGFAVAQILQSRFERSQLTDKAVWVLLAGIIGACIVPFLLAAQKDAIGLVLICCFAGTSFFSAGFLSGVGLLNRPENLARLTAIAFGGAAVGFFATTLGIFWMAGAGAFYVTALSLAAAALLLRPVGTAKTAVLLGGGLAGLLALTVLISAIAANSQEKTKAVWWPPDGSADGNQLESEIVSLPFSLVENPSVLAIGTIGPGDPTGGTPAQGKKFDRLAPLRILAPVGNTGFWKGFRFFRAGQSPRTFGTAGSPYDLIFLGRPFASAPAFSGPLFFPGDRTYTIESIAALWQSLSPAGALAAQFPIDSFEAEIESGLPVRFIQVARDVILSRVEQPETHFFIARSESVILVLVKKNAFGTEAYDLADLCKKQKLQVLYTPYGKYPPSSLATAAAAVSASVDGVESVGAFDISPWFFPRAKERIASRLIAGVAVSIFFAILAGLIPIFAERRLRMDLTFRLRSATFYLLLGIGAGCLVHRSFYELLLHVNSPERMTSLALPWFLAAAACGAYYSDRVLGNLRLSVWIGVTVLISAALLFVAGLNPLAGSVESSSSVRTGIVALIMLAGLGGALGFVIVQSMREPGPGVVPPLSWKAGTLVASLTAGLLLAPYITALFGYPVVLPIGFALSFTAIWVYAEP